jgi:hypothetical protein
MQSSHQLLVLSLLARAVFFLSSRLLIVYFSFLVLRQLWRLPALIVDDFDDVTPELLRTAYVEALYRVDEFEFERLKQSWWWNLIANVSSSMSSQPLFDLFPPESEEFDFVRPQQRYTCWETNNCGTGTKRIPKTSC